MHNRELVSNAETKSPLSQHPEEGRQRIFEHPLLKLQRRYGNHFVQRVLALARKGDGETEVSPDIEQAIHQARSSGQALDSGVQTQMEPVLGADFSGVRVHTGGRADKLNQALNARAFTTGQDIFFKQGEYSPGSSDGRELLAHELTHVVQQSYAPCDGSKARVTSPADASEVEAARVAKLAVRRAEESRRGDEEEEVSQLACKAEDTKTPLATEFSEAVAGESSNGTEITVTTDQAIQRQPFDEKELQQLGLPPPHQEPFWGRVLRVSQLAVIAWNAGALLSPAWYTPAAVGGAVAGTAGVAVGAAAGPLLGLFAGLYALGQAHELGRSLGIRNAWKSGLAATLAAFATGPRIWQPTISSILEPELYIAQVRGKNAAIGILSPMRPEQMVAFLSRYKKANGFLEAYRIALKDFGGIEY